MLYFRQTAMNKKKLEGGTNIWQSLQHWLRKRVRERQNVFVSVCDGETETSEVKILSGTIIIGWYWWKQVFDTEYSRLLRVTNWDFLHKSNYCFQAHSYTTYWLLSATLVINCHVFLLWFFSVSSQNVYTRGHFLRTPPICKSQQ